MQLTKKQVTYIDDYLKHHQVKYWDIRIELLDHIVTKTEVLMAEGLSFDKALEEVHVGFGNRLKLLRNTGVEYSVFTNGDGYKAFVKIKMKEINRKYKRLVWKEFKIVFSSLPAVFVLVICASVFYFLATILPDKIYRQNLILVFYLVPFLQLLYVGILQFLKFKFVKTINLNTAMFYVGTGNMVLLNFILMFKPDGSDCFLNNMQFNIGLLVIGISTMTLSFCGFRVYKNSLIYYTELHQKLQQL
ncbi:MAG: hypothetical protein JKY08_06825 [Flavobacteriaceae bacterium]|nr:hypothetical protein [Flavobacteriaceae bacterium]